MQLENAGERKRVVRRIPHLLLTLGVLTAVATFGFLSMRNSVPNVSAVNATGNIQVYWDADLTRRVDSIEWGALSPGQTRKVGVYVHNEGFEPLRLTITPARYSPTIASDYLFFSWACGDKTIEASKTAVVALYVLVSPDTQGISDFSFDLTFEGNPYILADINGDGVVDTRDAILLSSAFLSTPGDTTWNPHADLNKDSIVDVLDALILSNQF